MPPAWAGAAWGVRRAGAGAAAEVAARAPVPVRAVAVAVVAGEEAAEEEAEGA